MNNEYSYAKFAAMNAVRQQQSLPLTQPGSAKWGDAVSSGRNGFQVLPDVLLRNQQRLQLDATDVVVLINILMHWWEPENWPHPRPTLIAKRMGTTARTVERHIQRMCDLGLMEWLPWEPRGDGPKIRRFDLRPLRERLEEFALQGELERQDAT